MPKRSQRANTAPKRSSETCLYLGCFSFDEPGEPDRSGSFQIVVEATTPEQAVDRFRSRLRKLRTSSSLFDDPITIYIDGFIELRGSFKRGLLVNWQSEHAPQPPHVTLGCLIPEQNDHECIDYGFDPDGDPDEASTDERGDGGMTIAPFLDFGGQAFRRAINTAKEPAHGTFASAGKLPTRARAAANVELEPQVEPTDETVSQHEIAEAQRKRRAALTSTVAELRAANKNRPNKAISASKKKSPEGSKRSKAARS